MNRIKEKERVVDYETREVREAFVECSKCEMEYKTDEAHPVKAGGRSVAYCTDCFKGEFHMQPHKTIGGHTKDSTKNEFAVIKFMKALRGFHSHYVESMIENLNGEMGGGFRSPDPIEGVFMLFGYVCVLIFIGLIALLLLGAVA